MASEDGPYTGLARILAGGSAIVTGVLTFLGIKDAALDRIVREEPKAVLLFGGMVAFGIVCGLIAQFARPPGSMRVFWIAPFIGLLIGLFPLVANHSRNVDVNDTGNLNYILGGVAVATIIIWFFLGPFRLAMTGCLLVLGAVLFALGTYGGIRLALDSKGTTASPEISGPSIVRGDDGLLHLKATVKAESLHACHALAVSAKGRELASTAGGPDGVAQLTIDMLVTGDMVDKEKGVLPLSATIKSLPGSTCADEDEKEDAKLVDHTDDDKNDDKDDTDKRNDDKEDAKDVRRGVEADDAKDAGWDGARVAKGLTLHVAKGAADVTNVGSTRQRATVNLPMFDLSAAPLITTTWTDTSTLSVALASTDEMGPTLAAIEAIGRTPTSCEVLSYAVVPIREGGDVAATIPVSVPAAFTDVEVRAMFLSVPPAEIPARDSCGSMTDKLSSVVVLRRPPPPRTG